jgi:iron(III) transport system substrate-binding protein
MLRIRVLALAGLAAALALSGCTWSPATPSAGPREAPPPPPPLIVYTARDQPVDVALFDAFGAGHGVVVQRVVVARDAMARALAESPPAQRADVVLSNDAAGAQALLAAGRLAAGAPGREHRWVPLTWRVRGLHWRADSGADAATVGWDTLADPRWRGAVCMRTSANAYQRSMLAMLIVQRGEEAARRWARGVVANFARAPAAGDYAQVTDLHDGRCRLAVANHGYALWMQHDDPDRKAGAGRVASAPLAAGLPNPGWGAVVEGTRQPVLAAKLLAFLLDPQVNAVYAAAVHEFPAAPGAAVLSPQATALGSFRPAAVDWPAVLAALPRADAIFSEVGWK